MKTPIPELRPILEELDSRNSVIKHGSAQDILDNCDKVFVVYRVPKEELE